MKRSVAVAVAVLCALAGLAAGLMVSVLRAPAEPPSPGVSLPLTSASTPAAAVPELLYTCARCHSIPPADALPRADWEGMIRDMNARIVTYNLGVPLTEAEMMEITAYYQKHAPASLAELPQQFPSSPLTFSASAIGSPPRHDPGKPPPVITHIRAVDLDLNSKPDLLICDAQSNSVRWLVSEQQGWRERILADLQAPAHAEVIDLNNDGSPEVVVACLGSFLPTEDPVGSIVLLSSGSGITATPLVDQLPRTADVRPADLDGDGDVDFAVALFGMYRTGGVAWLEQQSPGVFTGRKLHQINGVSHTPVGDINGDGRIDIVALVSQEHERVLLLTNLGGGSFETSTIYQAPHSLYGCSSIELSDLDKDGDLDVLLTNGDMLDFNTAPKPYHGVQWLENLNGHSFRYHDILRFYGAYAVKAADLDQDGDLDLVASSMGNRWENPSAPSLIWLENDGSQRFTPRPIATSPINIVCLEVADLSGDGRPEILGGHMHMLPPFDRLGRITLWSPRP